jgi:hypothetical protein
MKKKTNRKREKDGHQANTYLVLFLFFVRNIENNLDYIENNLESLSTIDGNQIKALIFPMIGIDYYI